MSLDPVPNLTSLEIACPTCRKDHIAHYLMSLSALSVTEGQELRSSEWSFLPDVSECLVCDRGTGAEVEGVQLLTVMAQALTCPRIRS